MREAGVINVMTGDILSLQQLSINQRQLILAHPACKSPLYLIVLVTELCQFGNFEKLNEKIADCLEAQASLKPVWDSQQR